jgi:hypothetical protein
MDGKDGVLMNELQRGLARGQHFGAYYLYDDFSNKHFGAVELDDVGGVEVVKPYIIGDERLGIRWILWTTQSEDTLRDQIATVTLAGFRAIIINCRKENPSWPEHLQR